MKSAPTGCGATTPRTAERHGHTRIKLVPPCRWGQRYAGLRELRRCHVCPLIVINAELSPDESGEQRRTVPDLDLLERVADAPLSLCLVDRHPDSLGQQGYQVPLVSELLDLGLLAENGVSLLAALIPA